MGNDNATGIGLDGCRKDDLWIGYRGRGAAGGYFKYTQHFIGPVEQQYLELLYKLKLVVVPGLKQHIVGISGTGNLCPL